MTLKTELKQHQGQAVEKLKPIKVGALYMEMGTGKTRTALELNAQRLNMGKVDEVLWLCPYSAKPTIRAELRKHLECGSEKVRVEGIESLSSSVRLNEELLSMVRKQRTYLVVDESNLVKNHRAQRTQNIERIATYTPYRLILNGTPISRCEKDLFSQWYILDWRILGYKSFWSFAANHLEYDKFIPGKINRVLNKDYLVRKIAPYTYQIRKEECLTLPQKRYKTWYYELTNAQYNEYEKTKEIFLMLLDELQPATIYRLFTALQHVVSGNRIVSGYNQPMKAEAMFEDPEENPRIRALSDLMDRIGNEKVIIWCKYSKEIQDVSQVLRRQYGKESTVEFYGEISKTDRERAVEEFARSANFFVANRNCGGYALNLQFCHNEIYYSNDWNYATRAHSEDRVHRMGQTEDVWIYDICAESTIDERILKSLWHKENLVDSFKRQIDRMKNEKYDVLGDWIDGKGISSKGCA